MYKVQKILWVNYNHDENKFTNKILEGKKEELWWYYEQQ